MTTRKSGAIKNKVMHILTKRVTPILSLFMLMYAFTCNSKVAVTILADDDYPPYSYVENGELKGIYIALLKRASTQLKPDYHVKIIPTPWKRALLIVKKGDAIGIVPPYLHYDSRPFISSYSVALGTEFVVSFCREKIELKAALKLDQPLNKAVHLGMNAGYLLLSERYKKAIAQERIQLWENKSTVANVIKLLANKIDCYVNDRKAIQYELNRVNKAFSQYDAVTVVEQDQLSHRTAHIGFSREFNYPYKDDFIKRMNKALLDVLDEAGNVKE